MKKIIAYCIIFTMVLSILPMNAFASEEPGFTTFISGDLNYPYGIAIDSSGNVYVTDTENHRIQKFDSDGNLLIIWGSQGSGDGQFKIPRGIAVDSSGVYVADTNNHRIQKFNSNGSLLAQWGSQGVAAGQFYYPYGVAIDSSGNVYVTDRYHLIQKFDSNGNFMTKWGSEGSGDGQFSIPFFEIAVDSSGNLYVADTNNHRIQKYDSSEGSWTSWGSEGSGDGQFYFPYGIAVDSSGNVYVSDSNNFRIQKFDSSGKFLAKWGSIGIGDGQFYCPYGIAVDSSGNVYVADSGNNRIQKMTAPITAPMTNADKVAVDKAALTWDTIKGTNTLQDGVTSDLTLTVTGAVYGSDITWSSNNTAVINNSGVVTRPSYESGDAAVTVTAAIYNSGASDTKDFSLVFLKLPQTNYTVTFDKNGGSSEADPTTKTAVAGGNVGTLPSAPTRSGYTFNGWNTAADGTGTAFTETTAVNTNITVYAQWKPVYSIMLDTLEHGSISADKSSAEEGDSITFTMTGDEGWNYKPGTLKFTNPASGADITNDMQPLSPPYVSSVKPYAMPASDILVSAEFVQSDYSYLTIADGSIKITEYIGKGGNIVIPSAIEGKNVTVLGTEIVFYNRVVTGIRIPNTVTTLNSDVFLGGGSIKEIIFEGNAPAIEGKKPFAGIPYDATIYFTEGAAGFTTPTWYGYPTVALPVYQSDADKVAADIAALDIGYAAGDNATSVTQNLNLTVTGAVYGSSITWMSDNPMVISNSGVVYRPSFSSGDAAVTITATVYNAGASDTKDFSLIVLKLPQTNYTVTFDKNGGDTKASPSTKTAAAGGNVGTLPTAPTRSGYNFNGWNTAADGTGTAFTATTTVNADLTVYAQWTKKTSGGGSSSGGGGTTTVTLPDTPSVPPATITETPSTGNALPSVTATTSTEAKADSNGNTAAAVTESQMTDAINKAIEAAAQKGGDTQAKVEIKVTAPAGAKSVETSIPKAAFTAVADGKTDELTVSTPIAMITFDDEALSTISKDMAGDVKITASKVDYDSLSEETKQKVGDRPVFNFSVTSGDKTISQFGGNVEVAVPYTPKAGEDPNSIVIYYINAEGKLETVSNCTYDPATGMISFKTNHFSQYAVGYNKVNFTDVAANAWYSNAVSFIAARGITSGTGNGNYSPEQKLTRGEFLVMMMKAYGISPDTNAQDNFLDAGDTYYTNYLAAAKRLGISAGVGNDMFAPSREITRQEMFTLLYNLLNNIGQLPQGDSGKRISDFIDTGEIAPWAENAMTFLVETGIIGGYDGKLNPESTTTRAEMAQVLYNLLSK